MKIISYYRQTHHKLWLDGLVLVLFHYLPIPIYVSIFLYCLCIQDYYTYYISKKWILPSLALLIYFHPYSIGTSLIYGILSYIMYRKHWMGMADVAYMFYFGLLIGYERMTIAVLISVIFGFLFFVLKKENMIPYLSCLSIGILFSLCKGYTLFYSFI